MVKDVRSTRRYRVARALMFQIYGTVCIICGHPGARQADHLVPISQNPHQPIDPHGLRPAHGNRHRYGDDRCPTCGLACNQSRGAKPLGLAASEVEDYEDYDLPDYAPKLTW